MRLACCILSLTMSAAQAVTLTVGSAAKDPYHDIQSAVDALPDLGGEIRITPGIYRQKIIIAKSGVTLRGLGHDARDVVLVFDDSAARSGSTFKSYTMLVSGDDFHATNLTIQNDYWLDASHPPSQAVALNLIGDRAVLDHVRLLGHQDTLYANKGVNGKMARQYFSNCYIEGHVDFIFGNAKAYFHRCQLHGLANAEVMITAQSRNSADEDSAYVFDQCRITAEQGAQNIYLGRPWRAYSAVIFIRSIIDTPLAEAGWREWHPDDGSLAHVTYAEYLSSGVGANEEHRHPLSHQLTSNEVEFWSLTSFFHNDIEWIPKSLRR